MTIDLEQKIANLRASLRPGQRELADWQAGPLAVSAVPGAGKSYGMAVAAALTLARQQLNRAQQLVIVTFTRSAATHLKQQVRQHLRELQLPMSGFTVQTLHGLALNIASRHPQLSGIHLEQVTLITPNRHHRLLRQCVEQWVADHPQLYQALLVQGAFDGEETERLRRQSVLRSDCLPELAAIAIREAKSSGLSPQQLYALAEQRPDEIPVLEIAAGLYERYQRLLHSQQLIDYDDMILAALQVLDNPSARQIWQTQVFAVFEDEAQDSTPLQSRLLNLLAKDLSTAAPNLVRVGDPNQAINSTFTPADPIFFRQFCRHSQGQHRLATMNQAGRSSAVIIEAANFMLDWINQSQLAGQEQPFQPQAIQSVAHNDPQANANPAPQGQGLEILTPEDVYQTADLIGQRVCQLLTDHPEANAAVLVRENKQGSFLAERFNHPDQTVSLAAHGIDILDVGGGSRQTQVPLQMLTVLQFLARPHSPDTLKAALQIFVDRQLIPAQDVHPLASQPETFLYPGPLDSPQPDKVQEARRFCCKLLRSRWELPHYRLISFLALAMKYNPAELATADKLAARLAQQAAGAPSMTTTLPILQELISAERFDPVEVDEVESQYLRPRQLTIITMHKAKGLDWDFVFLPFLHARIIPGELRVPAASQFLGPFSLAEVARAQIRASVHNHSPLPNIETAWQRASDLKSAEEFRLLYVAMTRAKRLLWMSAAQQAPYNWNWFDWQRQTKLEGQRPCPILDPLQAQFPQSVRRVES
ncbi:ATP-dependent helicase [Acaryochloris sp. IP29b_bin.148]|uniref:ATP-dependent helicase n=1 Tax=Acaryochloris sp. IP29b_bin.148 TaxID=2969218 RepID=UPI00260D129E|nr:ATP-dependent helicase [Acaryochloris sp. IP29b_bin.148]